MATTFAANNSLESATMGPEGASMTDRRARNLPIPISAPISISVESPTDASMPHSPSSPRAGPPLPNPPFVFPARPASFSAPSSLSRATGRRPKSAIDFSFTDKAFGLETDSTSAESLASRRARFPAALPNFNFNPGASLAVDETAYDHRPRSAVLPEFSFNPAADLAVGSSLLSPPLSPASPRVAYSRGGHRRGGSEFVGGKLRSGEAITVMSGSPTKSESGLPSPQLVPSEPQRRGRHAHRRSAAISSHDLSMILKPSTPNVSRGHSAPTSPGVFHDKVKAFSEASPTEEPAASAGPEPANDTPQPVANPEPEAEIEAVLEPEPQPEAELAETEISPLANESEPANESESPGKPVPRARVGFSDRLEYIPRPLSVMSTDTSSTITARPGHSVSGSITSIISLSNSIDTASILGSPTRREFRPSTAGVVLDRTVNPNEGHPAEPGRRNSVPLLSSLPPADESSSATPSPTRAPKRWSFFGLESLTSGGSPTKARPQSSSSSESAGKTGHPPSSVSEDEDTSDEPDTPASSKKFSLGKEKKPKKVKSWAGSILTRKSKSRGLKTKSGRKRSLTPPLPKGYLDDDVEDEPAGAAEPVSAPAVTVTESSTSRTNSEVPPPPANAEDDGLYPMIDLDAALGPFNTPTARDAAWEEAQRASLAPKRKLHSAAGMRGFAGPGMHYHRRAESAPEMPPFEAGRFGIHRFGSSSTMADVFEEEEEDEIARSGSQQSPGESSPDAFAASVEDVDPKSAPGDESLTPTRETDMWFKGSRESLAMASSSQRKGSGLSLNVPGSGPEMRTEIFSPSPHEETNAEVESAQPARDQVRIYESISDYTDTAMPSPRTVPVNNEPPPGPGPGPSPGPSSVDVNPLSLSAPLWNPNSPYSGSHASSFPSPRSPMSYDAHRVSTAPSSVTEENNFQSLLMGEPGPELVRISVDVPSLTSSTSATTRESSFPNVRPRNAPLHDQRPASFTSTAFGRRRSSLASISRLISSAHGERSKLNMEVPCEAESDRKQKVGKARRLSRMMQFWKSKESPGS